MVGCSPWGCKESDVTEQLSTAQVSLQMNVAFVYGFIGIHGFHEARAEGFTFPVYPYLF